MIRPTTSSRASTVEPRTRALAVVAILLVAAALATMWPFAAALVLAAWAAHLANPLFVRFRAALRGRASPAALFTAALVVAVLVPLVVAVLTLIPAARSLLDQLRAAHGGKGVLEALVASDGGTPVGGAEGIVRLVREYGATASRALTILASVSLSVLLGAVVFFTAFYALLVHGASWWAWTRERTPVESSALDRLATAFHQAGRGLVVGSGLTALVQGGLAALLYAAFGVPRALLLGMLTVVGALVPMTGPTIVWGPICLGLGLAGYPVKALVLAALCAGLVGTIDNVIRPWLSRRFEIGMPTPVVLVSMLGGVVVLGAWGLFLGPLAVRLAGEVLDVCHERHVFGRTPYRRSREA